MRSYIAGKSLPAWYDVDEKGNISFLYDETKILADEAARDRLKHQGAVCDPGNVDRDDAESEDPDASLGPR